MTTPPKAEKRPHPITVHGDTRIDNYYWLRDDDRTRPEVLDYLTAENAYTAQAMQPYQPLREALYQEMVDRIPQEDASVPYVRHGFRYQTRYQPGKEYPLYLRQPAEAAAEWDVLLDANVRAEGHEFYTLGAMEVSPDNRQLALAEDFLS
ncbi:MAG: oligopeptidase B, partial [Yersiniaceae bacterium]|nr:oligopeptidase B [Yersiniaceae bacterium]